MERELTMIRANIISIFFIQAAAGNADCGQESNSQQIADAVLYQCGYFVKESVSKKLSSSRKKETGVSVFQKSHSKSSELDEISTLPPDFSQSCLHALFFQGNY